MFAIFVAILMFGTGVVRIILATLKDHSGGSFPEWFLDLAFFVYGAYLIGHWLNENIAKPLREMNEKKSSCNKCTCTKSE